jgi:hypothetical protein
MDDKPHRSSKAVIFQATSRDHSSWCKGIVNSANRQLASHSLDVIAENFRIG